MSSHERLHPAVEAAVDTEERSNFLSSTSLEPIPVYDLLFRKLIELKWTVLVRFDGNFL
jgi:hypothetical protein